MPYAIVVYNCVAVSNPTTKEILEQVPIAIGELTGYQVKSLSLNRLGGEFTKADLAVELGPKESRSILIVEAKNAGTTNQVAGAVTQLQEYLRHAPANYFPVVVVPFMGEAGRKICEANDVSWFDLSGNAELRARGLRIRFRGKPNQFKRRGRPKSLFGSSGARIARTFLIDPSQRYQRRELSHASNVSEGHTGNLVRRYLREGLLSEYEGRKIGCANPGLLLDAWREEYDFSSYRIVQGHMAVRGSGPELASVAYDRLQDLEYGPALTGLAAAWSYDHFAAFRLATVFVRKIPKKGDLQGMEFREGSRGANLWLAIPDNDGVYDAAMEIDGRTHVHPVQAYLDLKGHPERAKEAADSLRKNRPEFHWNLDGIYAKDRI